MQKRLREILIVDNYDSFTHNVAALVSSASQVPCRVVRAKEGAALIEAPWNSVIFGPGPSTPEAHPELLDCIARLPHDTPALGVCLGMQAFAHLHGGSLALLDRPRHGKLRTVTEVGSSRLFEWPNCHFQWAATTAGLWINCPKAGLRLQETTRGFAWRWSMNATLGQASNSILKVS